jgi:AraC-like DNA-binding protein
MNLPLSFPDIFLLVASSFLMVTILLLIKKINYKNYMIVGTLAIYFSLITTILVLILVTRYNIKLVSSATNLVLMTIVYSLYNVFHYFSLRQLITKKNNFKPQHYLHLGAVAIIGILIYSFLDSVNPIKGKGYNFVFETHFMLIQHKHYLLPLSRIVHPLIYFVLGGYLLYRSSQYLSTEKPTRIFIFFFYFQKVILYISVTIGFLGFYSDSDFYSSISITVFSLIAVSMSCYILLNPDILIQITKSRFNSIKKELDKSKLTDVSDKMNRLMDQKKLFLDAEYNLSKLSADTGISTKSIREVIVSNEYKNFAAYINSFRIAHAEKLISNGYLDMYSIESLCNDSGFQAEVTFYRVFKRINGCTPKEYSYNLKKTNEQVESISI